MHPLVLHACAGKLLFTFSKQLCRSLLLSLHLGGDRNVRLCWLTLRQTITIARRLLEENDDITLKMRWIYADALYNHDGATLDELREAVTTLEDVERIARRVFGAAHPLVGKMEADLRTARAVLRAAPSDELGEVENA